MCNEKHKLRLKEDDVQIGELDDAFRPKKHLDRWLITKTLNATCNFSLKFEHFHSSNEI